jgi:amphi-Trp domain-containing protein
VAKKTVLMKSKDRMTRQDAAAFLRQLADKLESGSVTLGQSEQEVMLTVPDQVRLKVKADEKAKRRDGNRFKLDIKIEWKTGSIG